jgi:hypothetical protein
MWTGAGWNTQPHRLDVNFVLEMFMNSPLLSLRALFLFISLVESLKWPFVPSSLLATGKSGPRSSLDSSATGTSFHPIRVNASQIV